MQQDEVGQQAAAIYKSGYALNSTIEMLSATSVEVKIDRLQTFQQINVYYGKAVATASAAAQGGGAGEGRVRWLAGQGAGRYREGAVGSRPRHFGG